ncbi:MAG: FAD-dependent oxidoreductase [Salibacteraceae bacterium]
MKSCVVIGGAVIGHFSAYYLAKSGHQVTLVDESDLGDGCSYGNAGMVVPSHLVPIAQPGMISKGVRWMFNARSPFYIRPRLSKDLLVWCLKFYRSANEKHVQASIPALRDLSLYSKMLYKELAKQHADIAYREKGMMMMYQSQKVGEEEEQAAQLAKAAGLEVFTYDSDDL